MAGCDGWYNVLLAVRAEFDATSGRVEQRLPVPIFSAVLSLFCRRLAGEVANLVAHCELVFVQVQNHCVKGSVGLSGDVRFSL